MTRRLLKIAITALALIATLTGWASLMQQEREGTTQPFYQGVRNPDLLSITSIIKPQGPPGERGLKD